MQENRKALKGRVEETLPTQAVHHSRIEIKKGKARELFSAAKAAIAVETVSHSRMSVRKLLMRRRRVAMQ